MDLKIHQEQEKSEKVLLLSEFANRTGYKVCSIRKKLARGELSYFKPGRIILIPESEVDRVLGKLHKAIGLESSVEK